MSTFSSRLKSQRERRRKTYSDMAKAIGVAPSTYRDWELGRPIKGDAPYVLLARELNVSLHYLMTGEELRVDHLVGMLDELETLSRRMKHLICSSPLNSPPPSTGG